MKRNLLISLITFLLFSSLSDAQFSLNNKLVPGAWIRNWLICGPIPLQMQKDAAQAGGHQEGFSNDYLVKAGGEADLHVRQGDIVKLRKGSVRWIALQSVDSIIDLDKVVSRQDPVMAYAYTELEADSEGVWFIGLGSNDGGSLWLNGEKVWDYPGARGLSADDDIIPVVMRKGLNRILLKIEDRGNKWGFCARMLPFSSERLDESGSIFNITTGSDGVASVVSGLPGTVSKYLVRSINIVITDHNGNIVLNEKRENDFTGTLNLSKDDYQAYKAEVEISMTGGQLIRKDISFNAGTRTEHKLFSDGITKYRIALTTEASESEQWAARELHDWLKVISNIDFPVESILKSWTGPQIVLGYNEMAGSITKAPAPAEADESFRYVSKDDDIFIFGGKARGTMYGVMAFLENELGCRWYTPGASVIPRRNEFIFTRLDHSEGPGIRVRNDFYFEAFDPVWAARNRMNGFMNSRKQPGGTENYWGVHTFYPLVPPAEFFKKHPEYYSLLDGKRSCDNAQLCLTNPDVLRIITERIKKTMHDNPDYLIYDVSQNDCYNPCQCEKCQAIVRREGSESGLIIWFVNQVAEAVEKEFPDKFIGTLAYQYTRTPPKHIHPRNNVVVRLCSIECCFAHDFRSCPENRSFLSDLETWSSIAPHLYIWDYVVNFSHYTMPYPNFSVLQPNIQTFRANNSIGIMEQAAYQSRGGEFSELRAWLIAKLLWNPECNTDDVINDFISGYYGRSGRYVKEYFDLLQGRITADTHIHLGLAPDDKIFSDQFVSDACEIFRNAENVADNDDILRRVQMAYLPVLYLKCKRSPVLAKYDGSYDKFCRIAKREGVTFYAEAGEQQRILFHKTVEEAR